MKALTLWQPWASLLLVEPRRKLHETRPWTPPAAVIGQRIATHASQLKIDRRKISDELHAICVDEFGSAYERTLPRGYFVGFATVASAHRVEDIRDTIDADDFHAGNWRDLRHAWRMEDVRELNHLIAARGFQKLWSCTLTGEEP